MKRMICIAGSIGMLLMASSAYGQNFQSVLKQNMELKSGISNLKGELATKNSTIKRLKDLLADRNVEIRKLKEKLRKAGVTLQEDVRKYKNRQIPRSVLNEALLKELGPTHRKGVKRLWGVNYFPISGNRTKTCLSIDWSLNNESIVNNEAIDIINTVTGLTEHFDYLILRVTAASKDKFGRLTETIPKPTSKMPNPLILKKEDILKINWSSFDKNNIGNISDIDSKDRERIEQIMSRDRRFQILPPTR